MTRKKQILVVEDNLINREMLAEILSEKYTVLQAENGQEALDILKQAKDTVSLVLLDVIMPVMDGYTFLDRVKEDKELSLIPVIVTTQCDDESDEIAALAHGATEFVPKPYQPQVILRRVASLIKLRETAAIVNQFKYDRLTGVYSKEYFCHKVRERLMENPDKEYSIICSNIENFKLYNDVFGFQEGDRLLKEIAVVMQKIVGTTGYCCRFGADRFLCFQEREKERQDREKFLNASDIDFPVCMKNIVMRWGIYEIDDRSISVEQMCDRAQLATVSIKGQYNNFFAVYDDSLRSKMLREKAIADSMETALNENQFIVYLQPKYSLNDESMTGAEALVRWNHPKWGIISPGEFIPLFEKNGFIYRLDKYVWEKVCCLLSQWKKEGRPLVQISVNVSRADLYQPDLVDTILNLIKKYDIEPEYLHLEITETAYAENSYQIISVVEELHKQGFCIEMDDFGSGYSSLNMLSQMELDILKLDMKFIKNETEKTANQSILSDIIIMAHKMYLSVVAEGVETREQLQRLESIGCDYVQGYFFSRPIPIPEFEDLLNKQYQKPENVENDKTDIKKNKSDICSLIVADEDDGYRELVRKTFEGEYRILETTDANSTLDCIMKNNDDGIVAVILSVTLPDNGASEVMKALRQNTSFWGIPVLTTIPGGDYSEKMPPALETDDFVCKCHPLFDLSKRVHHLVYLADSRKQIKALHNEIFRDYLTGLINRRGFYEALSSIRDKDLPIAVCLFDLDNLKNINDTCGHDTGDRLIQAFADILRRNTRSKDVL